MPAATRRYDRDFSWVYGERAAGPPRGGRLVPVTWDGLALNTGDQASGLCSVIENVEGWLDSPPLTGNDAGRAIADGAAWGPKTLEARIITLHGAAAGPRDELGWLRDQLAARAAARTPADLVITDGGLDRTLSAEVRAGTERFRHTWLGGAGFRWQVTLTAADPLLYDSTWQTAELTSEHEDTGRPYPRDFGWRYAVPYLPNTTRLANTGNHDAPAFALYQGDLSESRLTDGEGGIIRLAALQPGMQVRVSTATLSAEAAGGLSRASFVLPGSRPMTVPAWSTARWHLYAAGGGSVILAWRSAWI
jgi:hypothetical protein